MRMLSGCSDFLSQFKDLLVRLICNVKWAQSVNRHGCPRNGLLTCPGCTLTPNFINHFHLQTPVTLKKNGADRTSYAEARTQNFTQQIMYSAFNSPNYRLM